MRLKITHYSTTSNGEQMAAWTPFEAPIIIKADKLESLRTTVKELKGGTIYLRYEEIADDRQDN